MTKIPFFLGNETIPALLRYCTEQSMDKLLLVADGNTYPILGKKVENALKDHGFDVRSVVFYEPTVVPNEDFIFQVLLQADQVERTFLAVGSGTVTDITRIASHRTRCRFISLPTAPSVDGFTSPSASLVIRGIKRTVMAQPPAAVFADLPTLTAAPQAMIAAGYGDILGKTIALSDWKLGHLLWDEPYDPQIAARVRTALNACIEATDEIGKASPAGIGTLMFSLVDSGQCMLDFGNSRPAAGCEHYMSHFIEMKLLREGRPAVLHGAKVGICTYYAAQLYEKLRYIDLTPVKKLLSRVVQPDHLADVKRIRTAFGSIYDDICFEQTSFLKMSASDFVRLKQRIIDNWEEIRSLAAEVPTADELSNLLRRSGGEVDPTRLGLGRVEIQQALTESHFLRNRFTICKLAHLVGLPSYPSWDD